MGESWACLSTDGKRPVSLLKSFFSPLAPAFCLKVCVVPGSLRADLSGASELPLANSLSTLTNQLLLLTHKPTFPADYFPDAHIHIR